MTHQDDAVMQMVNKQAIHEAVMRYCRGIDRLDMTVVRSAYHPDGVDHHTDFDGHIDEFIAWVEPLLRKFAGTRHDISNHLAEIRGDEAVVESYGIARHWGDKPEMKFTTGVRYVDYFEQRKGTWAIAERFAVREWLRHDSAIEVEDKRARQSGGEPDIVDHLKNRLWQGPHP